MNDCHCAERTSSTPVQARGLASSIECRKSNRFRRMWGQFCRGCRWNPTQTFCGRRVSTWEPPWSLVVPRSWLLVLLVWFLRPQRQVGEAEGLVLDAVVLVMFEGVVFVTLGNVTVLRQREGNGVGLAFSAIAWLRLRSFGSFSFILSEDFNALCPC